MSEEITVVIVDDEAASVRNLSNDLCVKLSAKEKDYRPAIVLDDVHNRTFKNVSANVPG